MKNLTWQIIGIIIGGIAFTLCLQFYDWKLALIIFLFGISERIDNKYRKS